jgi:hypothetical protein
MHDMRVVARSARPGKAHAVGVKAGDPNTA